MTPEDLARQFNVETEIVSWDGGNLEALHENRDRYAAWRQYAESQGLYPSEYLLPRILCHCPPDYPDFMRRGVGAITLSDAELATKLQTLGPWSFHFKLRDAIYTNDNTTGRNRLLCRSGLISATVASLLGERLAHSSFLDMGCHSGFFSFDIAARGAARVTGIELRDSNLAQANFLLEFYGLNNVEFRQGNIMSAEFEQDFTVVYNLGLLYHVTQPIELMQKTYDLCTEMAVIDTVCHREPISAFIAAYDKDIERDAEGDSSAELHPTYRALIDTMRHVGFKDLIELVPHSGQVAGIYATQTRRCIIGFK